MRKLALLTVALGLAVAPLPALAQAPAAASTATPSDYILLTVFFRHDQTKNLDELNKIQEAQGFAAKIPPPGVEVVSWHVVMGIGQVAVFKVPPARLRELNRAIEQGAWGAFKTEFYPTYDLTEALKARSAAARATAAKPGP